MRVLNLRNAALALVAGIGLAGCAYGPYGGLGVGVGYGNNGYYDPYYGGYGYGSRYGYGASYGYGSPYFGWYDGFYYPGTGYYVYDRYRRPYRWSNTQRHYWTDRQRTFRRADRGDVRELRQNWTDFRRDRRSDDRAFRVERREDRQALRSGTVTREQFRTDRRQDKRAYRKELRSDRRNLKRENRRDRRD
jgi:hypothetical protein